LDPGLNVPHLLDVLVVMLTNEATDTGTPTRADRDDVLRTLYAEHGRAVFCYAARFTADRGRAEDVVQETFLRAWRQLPGLVEDDRPVRAWLLRVARRLLIDAVRAAGARPGLAADGGIEPTVDGGLDHLLDQSMIVDALRRLSPAHQQIVIETFFVGRPMHLTAARLGVPAGTARSRLHYALGQLRRQLESTVSAA
jgi:RNA polymerase sigma-70 factor (ECF subfamily)